MKTGNLLALVVAFSTIVSFNGAAFAAQDAVTGGGYLENGYKCGIGVVKTDAGNVDPIIEGTLHCMSVTANGKSGRPIQLLIDCDPVNLVTDCTISSSHPVASATIMCKGGKQVDVTSGVDGSPVENGTIAATGGVGINFPATPVLHGTVNVQCK